MKILLERDAPPKSFAEIGDPKATDSILSELGKRITGGVRGAGFEWNSSEFYKGGQAFLGSTPVTSQMDIRVGFVTFGVSDQIGLCGTPTLKYFRNYNRPKPI